MKRQHKVLLAATFAVSGVFIMMGIWFLTGKVEPPHPWPALMTLAMGGSLALLGIASVRDGR